MANNEEYNSRLETKIDNNRNKIQQMEIEFNRTFSRLSREIEQNKLLHEENRNRIEEVKDISIRRLEDIITKLDSNMSKMQKSMDIVKYSAIMFVVGMLATEIGITEVIKKLFL